MKTFSSLCFLLFIITSASAQNSGNAFCTRLDSVLNFFTFTKPEIKGQQIRSDGFNTFYQSRIRFSKKGRTQISVSKKETQLTFFTEWLGENLAEEKAGWMYDNYFSELKNCLGDKFSEKPSDNPESKWALYYNSDYVVGLHWNKDSYSGLCSISISVYPPEEFDY